MEEKAKKIVCGPNNGKTLSSAPQNEGILDQKKAKDDDSGSLFAAVADRKLDRARELISKGANVNPRTTRYCTALHVATLNGPIDSVKLLVENGAVVNVGDNEGKTPLHDAAVNNHTEIAEYLIEKGANVNARTNFCGTPLHIAAAWGRKEMIGLLIEKGADINARDSNGETAMHIAVRGYHAEIVKLLIDKKADINARDAFGRMPLDFAPEEGIMWRLLIGNGAKNRAMEKINLNITVYPTNLVNDNKTDPESYPFFEKVVKAKPAVITSEEANNIACITGGSTSIHYKRDSEFSDRRDLFDSFTVKSLFTRGDEVQMREAEKMAEYFAQRIIEMIRELEWKHS
jgi:ankyrin repeat protein